MLKTHAQELGQETCT